MKEKTGKTSVPQIFFHDRHIGGNVELQKLLDSDKDKEEALAKLEAGPGDGELPVRGSREGPIINSFPYPQRGQIESPLPWGGACFCSIGRP